MSYRPPIPASVLLLSILLSWVLSRLIPLWHFPIGVFRPIGVTLIIVGIAMAAWKFQLFQKHQTTPSPVEMPTSLITDGLYRFSRNPIYVSYLLIALGFGFSFGSISALLPPVGVWWVLNKYVIPREEQNLHTAFGERYIEYAKKVRRWV